MPKEVVAPVPTTLTEQKANFTAEGSPPPGKVATTPPVKDAGTLAVPAVPKASPGAAKKSRKRAG